jgi:hypothetical protein
MTEPPHPPQEGPARFGKGRELRSGRNQLADDNRCGVFRILGDEGMDGRRDLNGTARSRRCSSRQELLLHLGVGPQLAGLRLPEPCFDLRDETVGGRFTGHVGVLRRCRCHVGNELDNAVRPQRGLTTS